MAFPTLVSGKTLTPPNPPWAHPLPLSMKQSLETSPRVCLTSSLLEMIPTAFRGKLKCLFLPDAPRSGKSQRGVRQEVWVTHADTWRWSWLFLPETLEEGGGWAASL